MNNKVLIFLVFLLVGTTGVSQNAYLDNSTEGGKALHKIINNSFEKKGFKNFPLKLEGFYQALKIAEKNDNSRTIGILHYYLSIAYYSVKDYSNAEKHLTKAIETFQQLESDKFLLFSQYFLTEIKFQQDDFKGSEAIYNQIESDKITGDELKALDYFYKGNTYLAKNNYSEALVYFNQTEVTLKSFPSNYQLAYLYHKISYAFFKIKDFENSLTYAEKALILAKEEQLDFLSIEVLELFSKIYNAAEDNILALEYASQSNRYKDSLLRTSNTLLSNEITKRKTNTSDRTISELYLTNSEQEKSLKFNQLAIVLSVLLITILSLLTLSLYKNNNLRAKANNLLQNKNKELINAKEKAEAATKAREQFLSTITHELRTPIYAITGLTYLLIKENPTDAQKEHLNSLKYSGEHLLSLINNILDLNKLEANKVRKVNAVFHLKSHMKNFLNTLRKPAEEKDVHLHLELDDDIPAKLNGDMMKVSQVLINLVGNSIKFAEHGDVWIRVKHKNTTGKKEVIRFEIQDNGVGIPKRKQKSIFQKFDQGPDEINVKYGGTGLGLPIVKNLLLFLGSEIHLESEEGKGTLFYFDMPFDSVLESTPKENLIPRISKEEQQAVFKAKRVLVVEDNKLNQKITRKILERCEMEIDLADNGQIAVEKAEKINYDLILMDIHMPVMDGIKATQIIRKNNSSTAIIALTAVSISEGADKFLAHGFTDIIPKPYKTELFFEKIYKVLNNKSQ